MYDLGKSLNYPYNKVIMKDLKIVKNILKENVFLNKNNINIFISHPTSWEYEELHLIKITLDIELYPSIKIPRKTVESDDEYANTIKNQIERFIIKSMR